MTYKPGGGGEGRRSPPMTRAAQQQPKEYIISEKLTSEIEGYLKEKFPDYIALRIPRLIRSNQHTTPARNEISNMEFVKGLAECFGSAEEFEECGICPLYEKCSRPSPAPEPVICEVCHKTHNCCQNAARQAREDVQPFIDLVRLIETKNREMLDLMRRNGMKIDNLNDPMQKLAFTFYSEIGEMAHKADVVIKEYDESLRTSAKPQEQQEGGR